jgi:hypothetical protein
VDQRYGNASRFISSSRPGWAVGKPMTVSVRRCLITKPRFKPAGQRLIGKQRIEVHRGFGHADALAWSRWCCADRSACRCHRARQPRGHEAFDQRSTRSVRSMKPRHALPCINAGLRAALVEPVLRARRIFGGRQPEQGQEIGDFRNARLPRQIVRARQIDQMPTPHREIACGIILRGSAHRFDKDRPA